MESLVNPDHIAVFLLETQIPENIGSVARAMNNMGLTQLVLVNPSNCDLSRVLKTATGHSTDLKDVFLKIGFINPQNPEHWMLNIRRFLSRLPLRAREVNVIRGVCRQIDWYTEQLETLQREGGMERTDPPAGDEKQVRRD